MAKRVAHNMNLQGGAVTLRDGLPSLLGWHGKREGAAAQQRHQENDYLFHLDFNKMGFKSLKTKADIKNTLIFRLYYI